MVFTLNRTLKEKSINEKNLEQQMKDEIKTITDGEQKIRLQELDSILHDLEQKK